METTTNDLLQPQAQVINLLLSFLKSMSLKAAIELGIPDALHQHGGGPMSLSDLVSALSIPRERTDSLRRLMRTLVHTGVFAKQLTDAEDAYLLTPTSRHLVTTEIKAILPYVRLILDPLMMEPSHALGPWFKGTSVNPFELFHAKDMWGLANEKPEFNTMVNEGMASDARLVGDEVVRTCGHVFSGLRSLVDVGGGSGAMARAVAKAFPEMKCTVFDLPHVIGCLEKDPLVEYVGGDMFVSVPKADAVLLKWILHDWSDEECLTILRHCKEAISSKDGKGKVIIMDIVVGASVDNQINNVETQLLFDILMMVATNGKEREEYEWKKIFHAAGFTCYKITPILGFRSIIELYV